MTMNYEAAACCRFACDTHATTIVEAAVSGAVLHRVLP